MKSRIAIALSAVFTLAIGVPAFAQYSDANAYPAGYPANYPWFTNDARSQSFQQSLAGDRPLGRTGTRTESADDTGGTKTIATGTTDGHPEWVASIRNGAMKMAPMTSNTYGAMSNGGIARIWVGSRVTTPFGSSRTRPGATRHTCRTISSSKRSSRRYFSSSNR